MGEALKQTMHIPKPFCIVERQKRKTIDLQSNYEMNLKVRAMQAVEPVPIKTKQPVETKKKIKRAKEQKDEIMQHMPTLLPPSK